MASQIITLPGLKSSMLPNCPLNTAAQPFITRPAPLTSPASPGPAPLYIQFQRTTYTSPQMLYHLLRAASQALTSARKAFPSPAFCPANSLKFKDAQLLCHEPPSWPLPGPTGYTEDRASAGHTSVAPSLYRKE